MKGTIHLDLQFHPFNMDESHEEFGHMDEMDTNFCFATWLKLYFKMKCFTLMEFVT
jgi:hypothetical protein